jgi:ATP-dependent DNA helicase RecG
LHRRLEGAGHAERDQRIDIDVAKTRVLNMLKQRHQRGQAGLSNAEVREVTGYTRSRSIDLFMSLKPSRSE